MILLAVKPGEEVIEALSRRAADEGIRDAAIVSLIGAVDSCAISNMPIYDARSDIITEYTQPFELSGTGEITAGRVHVHVVLGREGDVALAGHLHRASVETFFVHAYVLPMSDRP
jgi:Predicted DNA-binding protein with PD1-like DNA-binding motif